MNLNATIGLLCSEVEVEMERGPIDHPIEQGYIEKSGGLWCVRSKNPQDKNFGCYNSREQAEMVLHGKSFTGVE